MYLNSKLYRLQWFVYYIDEDKIKYVLNILSYLGNEPRHREFLNETLYVGVSCTTIEKV